MYVCTAGTTPVYFAAQEGQVETLKYLIVECDVDGRTVSNDGMQPIHAATQNGRLHAVKVTPTLSINLTFFSVYLSACLYLSLFTLANHRKEILDTRIQ